MTAGYTDNSQHLTGTESVVYRATDDGTDVAVGNALFGELSFREYQQFGSLLVEARGLAVELDHAEFATPGVTPVRGGRIVRSIDSTTWRIQSITTDHVIGVSRCVLTEVR